MLGTYNPWNRQPKKQIGVACIGYFPDRPATVLTVRNDVKVIWPPGGGIDPGESPLEAAAREHKEETGFEVANLRFHGTYEILVAPLGIEYLLDRTHVFSGEIVGGEIEYNEEVSKIEVCRFDELPDNLLPFQRRRILDVANGIVHKDMVQEVVGVPQLLHMLYLDRRVLAYLRQVLRKN